MAEYVFPDFDANAENDTIADRLEFFFEPDFNKDWADLAALREEFEKGMAKMDKQLIADHSAEKTGTVGHHSFHGFDAAMKAAFPGWPDDTSSYTKFRAQVTFRRGSGVITGDKQAVRGAYDRFVKTLWRNGVPENRFWPILKTIADGVKYCQEDYAERKYRVAIGPVITRRGEIFDSEALYNQKIKGRYAPGTSVTSKNESMKHRCIWVMSAAEEGQPKFYTHIGKFGRFHHSSFKAGEAISAAGEWVIAHGKLTHINACSGHYKPEAWRFLNACMHLKNTGALDLGTLLEVWEQGTNRVLVPCIPFMSRLPANLQSGFQLYASN